MKIAAATICLSLLLATAPQAMAGLTSGQVDTYWTDAASFYFKTSGTVTGKPACNTQSRFAVSLSTEAGRAIASQVAAAKVNGLVVAVSGKNTCLLVPDSEDTLSIAVSGTSSPGLPAQYWATSSGDSACASVCAGTGGAAAATSTGAVCKNTSSTPLNFEYRGNFFYECGGGNNRTAQCSCVRK